MKTFIGVIVAVVILGAGWYFVSPLFIDQEVDEAFPDVVSEVVEDIEETETMEELAEVVPSPEVLAGMSPGALAAIEAEVLERAAELPDTVMTDAMPDPLIGGEPSGPISLTAGSFVDADSFHRGSGSATIYELEDGSRILRLEDFSVTNGPDLHVLLSGNSAPTNQDEVKADGTYIDLGQLKGNKGDQNYEIPSDIDVSEYGSVVIYCDPFHVVFSTATLSR